jgi:hypothetical protein
VPNNQLASVEHIVVLMLENRSFDHMLGFLYEDTGNSSPSGDPFAGLTGQESNLDSHDAEVTVFKIDPAKLGAYFMPGTNPGEGYSATNLQLFGQDPAPTPPVATNGGFVTNFDATLQLNEQRHRPIVDGTAPSDIMGMFTPDMLPVLSGLARGYAVCDQWFCSVPTETIPNRAFAAAATSQGHMNDSTKSFTVPTIFGLLTAAGIPWKVYGYDQQPLTRLDFPDTTSAPDANFGTFDTFKQDAGTGPLPGYSFLRPPWAPFPRTKPSASTDSTFAGSVSGSPRSWCPRSSRLERCSGSPRGSCRLITRRSSRPSRPGGGSPASPPGTPPLRTWATRLPSLHHGELIHLQVSSHRRPPASTPPLPCPPTCRKSRPSWCRSFPSPPNSA